FSSQLTKSLFRLEATAREYDKLIEAVNRDRKFQQVNEYFSNSGLDLDMKVENQLAT
ncbi:hypothetical protein GW17_00013058, partial [Ensete ventricosum]